MSFDPDQMRAALHGSRMEIEEGSQLRSAERILEERLAELASRRLETEVRDVVAEVIVARRDDFLFATPINATGEVREVELVSLPGATDAVAGVFQIRGRTYSLVDIAPFFGESTPLRHGDRTLVAVVAGTPGELGIRIDEIIGPRAVETKELDEGLGERQLEFVSHVTRDLVHLIDIEALMASPRVRLART